MTPHTISSAHVLTAAPPHREYWFGLPALRASVKSARDTVRDRLCAWQVPGDLCCDAVLLISELTTNAVVHTRSGHVLCGLRLSRDESLRIEVHDDDHRPVRPAQRRAAPGDESGRGLFLVQQIADRWGADRSTRAEGNVVWAELGGSPLTAYGI
ncbi:ATP-binding protein [Streptomyces sp. NPDC026672]|uniref:ATP-binding protein n=1 Tax=unclassified Streptomyces TaxID=2593676 RepID=UPI0033FAAA3C